MRHHSHRGKKGLNQTIIDSFNTDCFVQITPLDLVKCRLQVNKEKYGNLGKGFKVTIADAGARGLVLGWAPTAIGYSMQVITCIYVEMYVQIVAIPFSKPST